MPQKKLIDLLTILYSSETHGAVKRRVMNNSQMICQIIRVNAVRPLPAHLDDPSYPYSEFYLLLRKLNESDRAIPTFHFRIWYFTQGQAGRGVNVNFHFGRRNGKLSSHCSCFRIKDVQLQLSQNQTHLLPFWNSWGRNVIKNRQLDLLFRQAALSLVPCAARQCYHQSEPPVTLFTD